MIDKIYLAGAYLRRKLYNSKIIKPKRLPVPVISVGNLTTGGTGKTPLVIWLSKYFISKGLKPVVLSRGYKRKSKGTLIVSDGTKIFTPWYISGDEPYLIAKNNIPVVVSESRYNAGLKALESLSPDLFILDDGFQHFQLHRDLNILVSDMSNPFWKEKGLPLGRLREPWQFYKYADVILATKTKDNEQNIDFLKTLGKPYFKTYEQVSGITDFKQTFSLDYLKNKRVVVFSGLGNNKYFFETVDKLSGFYNFTVDKFISFPDHYDYKNFKLNEKADIYLTTEKDLVKLTYLKNIFALKYEIFPDEEFRKFLDLRIDELYTKK